MKTLLTSLFAISLAGCVTLSGTYHVKAFDAEGNELTKSRVLTATGRHIYTARNALCSVYPKARIVISDVQTGQELAGESPYQCR